MPAFHADRNVTGARLDWHQINMQRGIDHATAVQATGSPGARRKGAPHRTWVGGWGFRPVRLTKPAVKGLGSTITPVGH